MKRLSLVLLVCAIALLGSVVTFISAQDNEERTFIGFRPADRHINFQYTSVLGDYHYTQYIPPANGAPGYTQVSFERYNNATAEWEDSSAKVFVYPVSMFAGFDEIYIQTRDALRDLVQTRLAQVEGTLPSLPYPQVPQILSTRLQYIDFINGAGLRYVGASAFGTNPVDSNNLTYSFQGLSADGAYYVVITAPLPADFLPAAEQAFYNLDEPGLNAYYANVRQLLETSTDSNFTATISALDAVAASFQLEAALETQLVGAEGTELFNYDGISFNFDAILADQVEARRTEAVLPGPDGTAPSMFGPTPGSLDIGFIGYPAREGMWPGEIRVYRTADYLPGTPADEVRQALTNLLTDMPALAPVIDVNMQGLPNGILINAAQSFAVKPEYVTFQNGRGVRFITAYTQSPTFVLNGDVIYTFGGITDDGQYLITMTLPINLSILSDEPPNPDQVDYESFFEVYPDYIAGIAQAIHDMPRTDLFPNLDILDALVASLIVE